MTSFKNEYDSIYRDTPNLNSQDQGFLGSIFFPNPVNEKLKTLDISGAVNIGKSKKELGASCFGCSMWNSTKKSDPHKTNQDEIPWAVGTLTGKGLKQVFQ